MITSMILPVTQSGRRPNDRVEPVASPTKLPRALLLPSGRLGGRKPAALSAEAA